MVYLNKLFSVPPYFSLFGVVAVDVAVVDVVVVVVDVDVVVVELGLVVVVDVLVVVVVVVPPPQPTRMVEISNKTTRGINIFFILDLLQGIKY